MTRPEDLDPHALYHLASADEWAAARAAGAIVPPSLEAEGFVHCSWGAQVAGTLARHFAGRTDLLALHLDAEHLDAPLVIEDSYGSGSAFPHVYGPVPLAAVIEALPIT